MGRHYWRLINDMRQAAQLALHSSADREFVAKLCGLKLQQAADDFERLLLRLSDQEDDGK